MKLYAWLQLILILTCISAAADTLPLHISELDRGGFLAMPTGDPPEMTSIAGPRFLELVPDSKQEVCYRLLETYTRTVKGLYRLRVLNVEGREVWKCSV